MMDVSKKISRLLAGVASATPSSKRSVGLLAMTSSKMLRSVIHPGAGTSSPARSLLLACLIVGALGVLCAHASGEKELLAPTGHLRVGVYNGSPTSMVADAKSGETHGPTYDLGSALAAAPNGAFDDET